MALVHVNIGSNMGDREANIDLAVTLILHQKITSAIKRSTFYRSEPWGFDSDGEFLNIDVMFDTSLEPLELLDRLQAIQAEVSKAPHRDAAGNYIDRPIDLDIISIDGQVIDHPRLQVPHPLMHRRLFVLEPLAELDPTWHHPILHIPVATLIARLKLTN